MSAIKIISSIGLGLLGPVCLLAQVGSGSAPDTYSYSVFFSSKLILGLLALGFCILFLVEWKENRRIKQQLDSEVAKNQSLLLTKQELIHSNQVAMHDLKSPLRTISSFVNLFLRKHGKDLAPEGREYLSFVQNAGQQLHQLIDEAKHDAVPDPSAWIDAGQVLQETIQQLNYDIQQTQAEIKISGEPFPQLNVLKGQLSRLFQNLIANGIKFTARGTSPVIMIRYQAEKQWHTFSVADQGIGIPKTHQHLVFERYQRLNSASSYEGSGLGLASCKQIIDQLGGRIWLTSQPGKGSTFYFQIPRSNAQVTYSKIKHDDNTAQKLIDGLRAAII
jgi:signal transduction histidine kinase